MDKKEKEISKFISLILRHKPEVIGISLDEHGWADVSELIKGIDKTHKLDMEILEKIVSEDEKQRYSFNDDKTLIRANQGHSINVDVELKNASPPEILWHGTGEKYVASILDHGLIPKSRLYVHLSKDYDTAVKVGSRHGKPVVFKIYAGRMAEGGYEFFISENGVWLAKYIPKEFIEVYEPAVSQRLNKKKVVKNP
ncbi:RNA 2'-phosphotransferase [Oribacterium sp. WCC10]|uniref:RNA 2'-phosphotransferase n=1 Tax=Oribacterium sp. WCC10 TaxID=1855343 RepID=UPI0008F1B6DB|nr:RNA 2'-phosphotransferase [Oribacterium sp. WCC10]SFG78335.1 putative RNA 2'-phosphotransferase [Oribacterium sp. WCC10]